MRDAAPHVSRLAAGVSATGHRATTIDVPIVSPNKALPQAPSDTSQTLICLGDTSPFATEATTSVTPAPLNGARTMVTLGAESTWGGTSSPTDATRPTTTTAAAWTLSWKLCMRAHEQAYAGISVTLSNTRAAGHAHQNLVMAFYPPSDRLPNTLPLTCGTRELLGHRARRGAVSCSGPLADVLAKLNDIAFRVESVTHRDAVE